MILHIGTYKTGSTSLQLWLRDHPDLLAKYGARFPYGWLRRDNHLELALALMRPTRLSPARMRGTEWQEPQWRRGLLDQVVRDLICHRDVTTILSAEDTALLRSHYELGALRQLVGDAHIVVYLRDPAGFLDAWQDTLTGKLGLPVSRDREDFNCVAPDSLLVDYGAMLNRWQAHFSQVTVFNYDRLTARDGSVIPAFARLLGIEPGEVGDPAAYWTNGRGGSYDHREPGLRWTDNAPFGASDG